MSLYLSRGSERIQLQKKPVLNGMSPATTVCQNTIIFKPFFVFNTVERIYVYGLRFDLTTILPAAQRNIRLSRRCPAGLMYIPDLLFFQEQISQKYLLSAIAPTNNHAKVSPEQLFLLYLPWPLVDYFLFKSANRISLEKYFFWTSSSSRVIICTQENHWGNEHCIDTSCH